MHDPARPKDSAATEPLPPRGEERDGSDATSRFLRLLEEISERLRPVCADWEEAQFQSLVRRIAALEQRWMEREGRLLDGRAAEHGGLDGRRADRRHYDGRHHDGRHHDGRNHDGGNHDGGNHDGQPDGGHLPHNRD